MSSSSLTPFFNPRGVAVIGASDSPLKISYSCIESLADGGFAGRIFPVNLKASEVRGLTAYRSIEDIPYDRPLTTMQRVTMCAACRKEYDDPLDRRFHAQPNCCPACGPALRLTDAAGVPVHAENPIVEGAALLRNGKILALKGLGISCLLARSYARIFFRNVINLGLPALTSPEAAAGLEQGDEIRIDLHTGRLESLSRPFRCTVPALPGFLSEIIDAGGMTAYVRSRAQARQVQPVGKEEGL